VDERKLARHLGLSRRRVKLASPEDALRHCGYAVGTVPPFGHRRRLRTLLDARVTRPRAGAWLWAGGGSPEMELRLQATELLRHTRPEVGDFAVGDGGGRGSSDDEGGGASGSSAGGSLESAEWGQGAAQGVSVVGVGVVGGGAEALPLPWLPGSEAVRLVGVIALRRRWMG
jgi:hypothetical protein